MNTGLKGLLFNAIGVAWTILQDFTPKRTLEEVSFFIDDIRKELFDRDYESVNRRLEAQLVATRESQRILVQNNASQQQINVLKAQTNVLEDLLSLRSDLRDLFAGSFSQFDELPKEWEKVSEHQKTSDFLGQKFKGILGRVFEDRELRDNIVRIKTRLDVQRQALTELKELISPDQRNNIEIKLEALNSVRGIVVQKTRNTGPNKKVASPIARNTTKEEIPIE